MLPAKYIYFYWLWTKRDFRSKYQGSAGGLLWAIIEPLATVIIYYLVFSYILQMRIPQLQHESGFFFYLLAGLLPWMSISAGISRAASSFVMYEEFLRKVVMPIGIIPLSVITTSLVPQCIGWMILFVALSFSDIGLGLPLLVLPVLFVCQLLITVGVGLVLSVLSIHWRDLLQGLPLIMQIFFYLTPIIWPKSMMAEEYHYLLMFNPIAPLIETYHSVFLGLPLANQTVFALIAWTLLLGIGGCLLYLRIKSSVDDYL